MENLVLLTLVAIALVIVGCDRTESDLEDCGYYTAETVSEKEETRQCLIVKKGWTGFDAHTYGPSSWEKDQEAAKQDEYYRSLENEHHHSLEDESHY